MFIGLLTGPIANAFRIHHKKRTGAETRLGVRDGYHLTWEKKELPGAGAGQYAWETFGLPPYAPFGFGNINVQNPSNATQPASYVFQAVGVVGNPPQGFVQGQFVTQPLMDPNVAVAIGIVAAGAIPAPPNMISSNSPILGP